ncbi:MAG: hypothetical protein SH850_06445 [Planctomycetaceae bacterium]|nr:hypothetical protein [Planctomycetaceae bacterium]
MKRPLKAQLPRDEVVKIASAQKMLLWAILLSIVVNLSAFLVPAAIAKPGGQPDPAVALAVSFGILGAALLVLALQLTSVIRLCLALKEGWATVFYAFFQLAPCISLILLLFLNGRATSRLQACGIRVGLMGAKSRDVAAYQPAGRQCPGCGETLEAAVTKCPVCGQLQTASPDFSE